MAVKKIDKSFESFYSDDVLVDDLTSPGYSMKVVKDLYIDEVSDWRYIVQYGSVRTGEFVGDKKYNGSADVVLVSAKTLRSSFSGKWTPGIGDVKPGDVLKDQNGKVFLVSTLEMVWSVDSGTHASLTYWERTDGKKFTNVQITHAGQGFSKYLTIDSSFSR